MLHTIKGHGPYIYFPSRPLAPLSPKNMESHLVDGLIEHVQACREETRYQQEHGHLPLPTDDSARNGGVSKDGDLTTIV